MIVVSGYSHQFKFYITTKSIRALLLANQLWVIVPVNPRKNRAFSELLYKSTTPQVSMGYKLINHLDVGRTLVVYKCFSCSNSRENFNLDIFSSSFITAAAYSNKT